MSVIYLGLIIVLAWLLFVAAVTWWWCGISRVNRKFNRVRGRALAKWLAFHGGVE
jgi:hypothetical protein